LKAVQVDHDHRDTNAFARGAQQLAGHVVAQEAPVVEIGQGSRIASSLRVFKACASASEARLRSPTTC